MAGGWEGSVTGLCWQLRLSCREIQEDSLSGSTGSMLPIPCNHHSSKGRVVPKSLDFDCLLFLKKKKSESSQRIETAWSNQSAI